MVEDDESEVIDDDPSPSDVVVPLFELLGIGLGVALGEAVEDCEPADVDGAPVSDADRVGRGAALLSCRTARIRAPGTAFEPKVLRAKLKHSNK